MFPSLKGRSYLKLANEMRLVCDLGLCLSKLGLNPRIEGRMHRFEIEAEWQRKSKIAVWWSAIGSNSDTEKALIQERLIVSSDAWDINK